MKIDERLAELGLDLPGEMRLPPGFRVPFAWVRVHGSRAYVSGHGAVTYDGSPAGPFGRVPDEVPLDAAQESARLATLALLGDLKRELGSLDRVTGFLTVSGFVNAEPGFAETTRVMNACSELLLELYGPEAGAHARTAIGVSALPLNLPVIISAEVAID